MIFLSQFKIKIINIASISSSWAVPLPTDYSPSKEERRGLIAYKRMAGTDIHSKLRRLREIIKWVLKFDFLTKRKKIEIQRDSDNETLDWWSKYFASLQVCKTQSFNRFKLLLKIF